MPVKEPVLTGPKGGRTVEYGGGSSAELKIAGEQSDGEWAVVEWEVHAGDEPPIHTHTREDEMLYVLEGSITAFVGDQRIDVEAGSYAALPKNVPPLPVPSAADLERRVVISESADELRDWLGIR